MVEYQVEKIKGYIRVSIFDEAYMAIFNIDKNSYNLLKTDNAFTDLDNIGLCIVYDNLYIVYSGVNSKLGIKLNKEEVFELIEKNLEL